MTSLSSVSIRLAQARGLDCADACSCIECADLCTARPPETDRPGSRRASIGTFAGAGTLPGTEFGSFAGGWPMRGHASLAPDIQAPIVEPGPSSEFLPRLRLTKT